MLICPDLGVIIPAYKVLFKDELSPPDTIELLTAAIYLVKLAK